MAKPIVLIEWPQSDINCAYEDGTNIADRIMAQTKHLASDYFVLLIGMDVIKKPSLKVFFEKDFNEVKYEELKAIISEAANKKREKNALPQLQKEA